MIIKRKNNIIFGLSKKKDGQMILRADEEGVRNRLKYFSSLGIDAESIISAGIIHDNNVAIVSSNNKEKIIKKSDGLITDMKNICLTVTVSDCLPIFIYDKKIIGIAHASWKCIIKNIVRNMAEKIKNNYNSNEKELMVFIGPHIKKCHFEIKEDVLDKFSKYPEFIIEKKSKYFVDLEGIVKKQFILAGLSADNITISSECTYCNKGYFSFRRDKPKKVTSQVAYIYIK
jgi:polyphenol oxidase